MKFSKALRHIDIKDVKKKHLEKVVARKIKEEIQKEEQKYVSSVMKQVKYNWRTHDAAAELREGMTTADMTVSQLSAQEDGESDLASVDTTVATSFSDNTDRDAPPNGLRSTSLSSAGNGVGQGGGFNIGNHLKFSGSQQPRWATLNAIDTTQSDTIVVNAIRGNSQNGGETPDLPDEHLQLWYHDSENRTWRPINQNPLGVTDDDVEHILIPHNPDNIGGPGEIRDWTLTLPSWARGPEIKFMLYQPEHSGSSFDHYGIKKVSYRRNAPITVFAPLDTPEASAFIRINPITYRNRRKNIKDRFAPRDRKRNLEKMMEASDKYVATYLGPDFPGMNSEIQPIVLQTFEQQAAAIEARDNVISKIKAVSDPLTATYDKFSGSNTTTVLQYNDAINELNTFGTAYKNAIDTQNYDEANRLVQNSSKKVIGALGGKLPIFDKSGDVSLAPVSDRQGRIYNPKYELTPEQMTKIAKRYGTSVESELRVVAERPYSYTLDLGMDNVGEMFEEDGLGKYERDPEKLEGERLISSAWGDRKYSGRYYTVGGKKSNATKGHWTPWYGGSGFVMYSGAEKPTVWDGVGWYPSRVGTNHWQGHPYDGLAYGAFFRLYVGDGLSGRELRTGQTKSKHTNSNGMSDAENLAYYLNFSGSSSYFATKWIEVIDRSKYNPPQPPLSIERQKLGTQRDGMTYFHSWYSSVDRLRKQYNRPPLKGDPFLDALRKIQQNNSNFAEPIEQSVEGEIQDEFRGNPEQFDDEINEFLPDLEDMDGYTADELEDMSHLWKGILNDKPKRDEYDNTRSGAKKYSEDLKTYKKNQELISSNTKFIDYYRNNLAAINSRDENGNLDQEKYRSGFKEGENSFFVDVHSVDISYAEKLYGSFNDQNPFKNDIGAFDKNNTISYDFSNAVNLGLSTQKIADLYSGNKTVTAANGKMYRKFGDLSSEYKDDAYTALADFTQKGTDRFVFNNIDYDSLTFENHLFSDRQEMVDFLTLERSKQQVANNLMGFKLRNRLVEVDMDGTPVTGKKEDFGAMRDAGTKVSGQSFPPDTDFDRVPVDENGFFTREFNANIDRPKGSQLTYTEIEKVNGQISVIHDNLLKKLFELQAQGGDTRDAQAAAAKAAWEQEEPLSNLLYINVPRPKDALLTTDGNISPVLDSIINNPLSNAIKSLADVVTFDRFDFDNQGKTKNPILNKINNGVKSLAKAPETFVRYLTNTGPKVIDNKYLSQTYVNNLTKDAYYNFDKGNLGFGDNILGTTQPPVFKNGKLNVGFTFGFKDNQSEINDKINDGVITKGYGKYVEIMYDALGDTFTPLPGSKNYNMDATIAGMGMGNPLAPLVGTIFGSAIKTSKFFGGAKDIPGNLTLTPKEIAEKNPLLYETLVDEGVMPDTERIFYGGINMPQYNTQPYFKKKKKDGEEYYVKPTAFDTSSVPFNINFNRVGDTSIDAPPTTSQQFTPQQSTTQSAGAIDAALGKMMDRHDAAMRKLEASQLNPNDKKSIDARAKLAIAQEKERRPLVNALFMKPSQQGEPIFPSAAASTLTTAQSKALVDKGAEVERVADFLNLGATNKELNDLTKDIKVASHTIDKPLPKKLPSFGNLFKASLLGRYLTGNNKQFTEKDLDNAQVQSMYNQTDQILRAKNTKAFGMDNGVSVLDLTDEMPDERKKAYGMKPGEKIYQVSSYQGNQVLQPLENNDLIYVLGRYVVITKPFLDAGAPTEKIKEIRDDFDFEYGFNVVRAYPDASGSDDIIGRVKGDETPDESGTLTVGKGIFGGGIPSELGIRGSEPVSTLVGRSIVNIGQGLGVGSPFPIRIKFNDQNYNDAYKYEDNYPVYESKKPKRGITLYEKVKKRAFNPKDIKPEFPKDPPAKLDPETGMHPQYGQQVARYRKLDQHSADAMPETGDPEIDAEVFKQKSPKAKKRLKDFQRNIRA